MPVLIEGISVVVKVETILHGYRGGHSAFLGDIPPTSVCSDNRLARVGFLDPADALNYVRTLEARGVAYPSDGCSGDFAVVDQINGFVTACDWAELGNAGWDGDRRHIVLGCRLIGDTSFQMALPSDWEFEGSLSQKYPVSGRVTRRDSETEALSSGSDFYQAQELA